jgi:hypothetical protein
MTSCIIYMILAIFKQGIDSGSRSNIFTHMNTLVLYMGLVRNPETRNPKVHYPDTQNPETSNPDTS